MARTSPAMTTLWCLRVGFRLLLRRAPRRRSASTPRSRYPRAWGAPPRPDRRLACVVTQDAFRFGESPGRSLARHRGRAAAPEMARRGDTLRNRHAPAHAGAEVRLQPRPHSRACRAVIPMAGSGRTGTRTAIRLLGLAFGWRATFRPTIRRRCLRTGQKSRRSGRRPLAWHPNCWAQRPR